MQLPKCTCSTSKFRLLVCWQSIWYVNQLVMKNNISSQVDDNVSNCRKTKKVRLWQVLNPCFLESSWLLRRAEKKKHKVGARQILEGRQWIFSGLFSVQPWGTFLCLKVMYVGRCYITCEVKSCYRKVDRCWFQTLLHAFWNYLWSLHSDWLSLVWLSIDRTI